MTKVEIPKFLPQDHEEDNLETANEEEKGEEDGSGTQQEKEEEEVNEKYQAKGGKNVSMGLCGSILKRLGLFYTM